MIAGFLGLMHDTIQIEPYDGQDAATGNAKYRPAEFYRGRVTNRSKRVFNTQGQEIVSQKTVDIGALIKSISPMDRITLPEGHVPRQPPIISAGVYSGENGPHHTEVLV